MSERVSVQSFESSDSVFIHCSGETGEAEEFRKFTSRVLVLFLARNSQSRVSLHNAINLPCWGWETLRNDQVQQG